MTGLMAALGAPPGSVHAQMHHDGGAAGQFHGEHNHGPGQMPHPVFQLFSSMGLMGPGGQMGDFVYSQEGLDRIITQLMEQTATSNAPGPASQSDIDALPRKEVTEDMLGPEHTAECSICMDEVNIGEQVTVLPCKHWFHHQCVSAWLAEHDTCPHCRKGISKRQEDNSNQPTSSGAQADPTNRMPGAFDTAGTGTSSDPIVMGDDAGGQPSSSADNTNSTTGNGGISDRIRRGLFGPQQ
jgi:E3 ubiquitin-protein ligase RNF115/126